MKIYVKIFIFAAMLASSMHTLAGPKNGSAIIPFFFKSPSNNSIMYFTNISDAEITVKITLYDTNGDVYLESTEPNVTNFAQGTNFVGDPLSTNGATLAPNKTGRLTVYADSVGSAISAWGEVTWESNQKVRKAMIGSVIQNYDSGNRYGRSIIPINDHKPF